MQSVHAKIVLIYELAKQIKSFRWFSEQPQLAPLIKSLIPEFFHRFNRFYFRIKFEKYMEMSQKSSFFVVAVCGSGKFYLIRFQEAFEWRNSACRLAEYSSCKIAATIATSCVLLFNNVGDVQVFRDESTNCTRVRCAN